MGHDLALLIGGSAGQGIQTIGSLLANIGNAAGLYTFSYDDFQSRIRGGHSFHLLRISDQPVGAPSLSPDILVAMDVNTAQIHGNRLSHRGILILNQSGDGAVEVAGVEPERVIAVPLGELARQAGNRIATNTVAAGVVAAVMGASFSRVASVVEDLFKGRGESVVSLNLAALEKGFEVGKQIQFDHPMDWSKAPRETHRVLSGAKAAALGALAADCRFFPFYPMSPGTPVVSQLSQYAREMPIVVEQAEDEIAAVNMAVGAAYAGVRSLVSTSGGGFSLMVEGLGLSGIAEIPIVIINAMRPGPATGLATRTAQADLLFSIHASQDEFPRFVFAPGTVQDTYDTVKRAVALAEKYQVPSMVLMDQYLMDSARTQEGSLALGSEHVSFLTQDTGLSQGETYHRYKFTENGISPRIRPCTDQGLVRSVGNEHTPEGFPSEDPENRVAMMDKRMKKMEAMKQEMRMPDVFCPESDYFLTAWGSSKGAVMETCLSLREAGFNVGWILFEDLWPLDRTALKNLLKDKRMILVEGNAGNQLGELIRMLTGLDYFSSVTKYDGRPLYREFIVEKVTQILEA